MHHSVRIHSRSDFVDDVLRDTDGILAERHDVLHAQRAPKAASIARGVVADENVSREQRRKPSARSDPREKNGKTLLPKIRLRPRFAMDFRVDELPF